MAHCDVRRVETLARKGAYLSERDAKGRTALHLSLEQLEDAAEEEEDEEQEEVEAPQPSSMQKARQPDARLAPGEAEQGVAGPASRIISSGSWLLMIRCLLHYALPHQCQCSRRAGATTDSHGGAGRFPRGGSESARRRRGAL